MNEIYNIKSKLTKDGRTVVRDDRTVFIYGKTEGKGNVPCIGQITYPSVGKAKIAMNDIK
jgi:hypothetical protein